MKWNPCPNSEKDRFIERCLTQFSTGFQVHRGGQCAYLCFPGVLLTSPPHNILSKPLAAFPHNHCRNNGQRWERNKSWRNDCHQSLKYWQNRGSNQRPPVPKSTTQLTELWGSAKSEKRNRELPSFHTYIKRHRKRGKSFPTISILKRGKLYFSCQHMHMI